MAKLAVFSTWMPACCSPLNGVTTGTEAPDSQPRLNGVRGLLNHRPMWVWWTGVGVGVEVPGTTENVWESKTPRTVAVPAPLRPVCTSVWYQDRPKGLLGSWMTKRSRPVPGGRPWTETVMVSLSSPAVIVALPPTCGRQALMPGDGTSLNENECSLAGPAALPGVAPAEARPAESAIVPARLTAARPMPVRIQ